IYASGAGPLVDDERYAGRSAAPSRAGATPLRNAAALGATDRAARLPRAGVAGSGYVGSRVSSDEGDACRRPLSLITRDSSCFQVSKELGVQFFAMLVQNGLRRFDESRALRVGETGHLVFLTGRASPGSLRPPLRPVDAGTPSLPTPSCPPRPACP